MRKASPAELNERSNQVTQARAAVRRALGAGRLSITDVMREQPPELGDRTLFEILLMARHIGRRRLRALNGQAVADDMNLAKTLADADEATREWGRRSRAAQLAAKRLAAAA